MNLRTSISTYNNLPLTNNFAGDIRRVIDTGVIYVWISQSSSGTLSSWNPFDLAISGSAAWGAISGDINDQTDLIEQLHIQGTDQGLDTGGVNEVLASELRTDLDAFKVTKAGDLSINITGGRIRRSESGSGLNFVDTIANIVDLGLTEGDGTYNAYFDPTLATVAANLSAYDPNKDMLIATVEVVSDIIVTITDYRTRWNFFGVDGTTLQINGDGLLEVNQKYVPEYKAYEIE